jgi:hypothetical protein
MRWETKPIKIFYTRKVSKERDSKIGSPSFKKSNEI